MARNMKRQHHMSLGYCNIKLATIIHLLEWPKSKTMRAPHASKNLEQELSFTVGRNGTWYSTLTDDSFAVSYKTKLRIYPELNLYLHKNLHTNDYSSFIYDWQNLEANKMSFNRWVDKQTIVHSDNWGLFSNKRNELSSNKKTWMNLKYTSNNLKRLHTIWF